MILHHAVACADVRYANSKRAVAPIEQMVHSFLELLPIAAFLLVCVLQFGQVQALLGLGHQSANFALRLGAQPLPLWYIVSIFISAIGFVPYAEELLRCVRAARQEVVR